MLSSDLAAGNMIRACSNGLALCKFDGRDGPLAIVAPDRNSQAVQLVKPNVLYRPGLPIRKDYGITYKLRLSLIECVDDRCRMGLRDWHWLYPKQAFGGA